MSISYEEALSTLQAMFGEPWTRDTLDTVLRHYQGHMENTVESILGHTGKDPQILLDNLKNGTTSSNSNTSLDEELARQLSSQVDPVAASAATGSASASSAASTPSAAAAASSSEQRVRGTPTTLPDDFLRVNSSTSQSTLDSDEALARMLQDKLFSDELARNPDFAHLAGQGRRPSQQQQQPQAVNRSSFTARGHQPMPMPNIMEKLSEMGNSAKFKLNQMAEQFKQNTNRFANQAGPNGGGGGGGGSNGGSPRNEMRGLLDDGDDGGGYELGRRKDL